LKVNSSKTETLVLGQKTIEREGKLGNAKIENVEEFEYLGSLLTWDKNDCSKDIRRRIAEATGVSLGFGCVWK